MHHLDRLAHAQLLGTRDAQREAVAAAAAARAALDAFHARRDAQRAAERRNARLGLLAAAAVFLGIGPFLPPTP